MRHHQGGSGRKRRKEKGEHRYLVGDNGLDVLFLLLVMFGTEYRSKTANYLLCTYSLDQSCRMDSDCIISYELWRELK